jgi:hypothetical protein
MGALEEAITMAKPEKALDAFIKKHIPESSLDLQADLREALLESRFATVGDFREYLRQHIGPWKVFPSTKLSDDTAFTEYFNEWLEIWRELQTPDKTQKRFETLEKVIKVPI